MPALQPITRTEIAHDPEASRFFPARFAGTCAWTGLPFRTGVLVKRYLGAYVSHRGMDLLRFGGLVEGGAYSDYERAPADPSAILERVADGDRLWLVAADGTMRAFAVKGAGAAQRFEGGKVGVLGGGGAKSRAQLGALLRGAVAYRIDRMAETFVEKLLREQAEAKAAGEVQS